MSILGQKKFAFYCPPGKPISVEGNQESKQDKHNYRSYLLTDVVTHAAERQKTTSSKMNENQRKLIDKKK